MKKYHKYLLPGLIGVAVAAVAITAFVFLGRPPGGQGEDDDRIGVTVYDSRGNPLATVKSFGNLQDKPQWAYLQVALSEAAQVLAEQNGCSLTEADTLMYTQGYQLYTHFDSAAFEALTAIDTKWGATCDTAAAITDLNGKLLAVYSADKKGQPVNYAMERRSPYSAFKALSVYTPAVEKGVVSWSALYQDSPYKQIKDDKGNLQDWPVNDSLTYSQEQVTVYDALRKSLNTVAVKCLADVGIRESMEFLQTNFQIPLKEEEYVVQTYGEEEVIGNMALGYLETGVTPVEMAGYYQIFANGGLYAPPSAIEKICASDGTAVYTASQKQTQVIAPATADTMNKLLQGVLASGGTGVAAACPGVAVAGKTGTGDDYADNWFVGVTPGYSLAVWHGQSDTNQADNMFSAVVQKLYSGLPNANKKFVTHQNLYQIAYCVHSGKAISANCTRIDIGYFPSKDALPACDQCGKK